MTQKQEVKKIEMSMEDLLTYARFHHYDYQTKYEVVIERWNPKQVEVVVRNREGDLINQALTKSINVVNKTIRCANLKFI